MQNTIDVRRSHEAYEAMDVATQETINDAYRKATVVLKSIPGLKVAHDDRAEELVAALTHYVIRCREK